MKSLYEHITEALDGSKMTYSGKNQEFVDVILQNTEGKMVASYACCVFFLRYIFSGSIFDEPEFILFMGVLFSLQASYSDTLKYTNRNDAISKR